MKKIIFLGLIAILLAVIGCTPAPSPAPTPSPTPTPAPAPTPAPTPAPAPKAEVINLFCGSTSSTSGYYAWAVAVARVVNKYAPGINITVVESGGGMDNVKKIREGVFQAGLAEGMQSGFEMYRGVETFAGNPWEPIRFFFMRNQDANRWYVLKSSSIQTFADFKGKKIYAGQPGSNSWVRAATANELLLNNGAELVQGSIADAVSWMQTGKIDAVVKSGPLKAFDAQMMAAHQSTPLRAIGHSAEEAAILNGKFPQYMVSETKAGVIATQPDHPSLWEIYVIGGSHTSSNLSQDVGYRIMKAVYEHWNEVREVYPTSAEDPIKDILATLKPGLEIPLHAGTVQYAKEIGIDVPAFLIPPEYKAK